MRGLALSSCIPSRCENAVAGVFGVVMHRYLRSGCVAVPAGEQKRQISAGRVAETGAVAGVLFALNAKVIRERRRTLRIAREPVVKSIEIDPKKDFPDIDRSNQVWPR